MCAMGIVFSLLCTYVVFVANVWDGGCHCRPLLVVGHVAIGLVANVWDGRRHCCPPLAFGHC